MSRLSILICALLPMVSPTFPVPALAASQKPGTILMFGARWCAPCMVEYRDLPGLIAAAAPDHIVLAWIDRPIASPAGAAGEAHSLSSAEARRLAHAMAGDGYGLPFSVRLDGDDHVCAMWRAPLHLADLSALRAQCTRPARSAP